MTAKHYDIVIIGGSFSARIAAVLLAKSGKKVLFIRDQEAGAPDWFHSSLFLEKLLGMLGARACFTDPKPIQVISRHARVTLQSDSSLAEELQREFGPQSSEIFDYFDKLSELGNHLEHVFWENGGLPWPSLKKKAAFRLLCLRQKLKVEVFEGPLVTELEAFPEPVRQFLIDLFQGLALLPIDQLSVGQAALLWSALNRNENVKEPDFSEILDKRFEQFHGLKGDLAELTDIHFDGKRWAGGQFKEGRHFEASSFLLGEMRWLNRFRTGQTKPLPQIEHQSRFQLDGLNGQLSPLLGSRIICGGETPMQLSISREVSCTGQVLTHGMSNEDGLRAQLAPVLPFAKYQAKLTTDLSQNLMKPTEVSPSVLNVPFQLANNLYCADSSVLLPGLGGIGAALVAWTLMSHLDVLAPNPKG